VIAESARHVARLKKLSEWEKKAMYSEKVMDHFFKPPQRGRGGENAKRRRAGGATRNAAIS
jgi:hypothetical protein